MTFSTFTSKIITNMNHCLDFVLDMVSRLMSNNFYRLVIIMGLFSLCVYVVYLIIDLTTTGYFNFKPEYVLKHAERHSPEYIETYDPANIEVSDEKPKYKRYGG